MKKKIIALLCIMVIMVPYVTMFAPSASASGYQYLWFDPADNALCDRLGFDPAAFFKDMQESLSMGVSGVDYWSDHPYQHLLRPGFKIRFQSKYSVANFYGSSLHDHYYTWISYSTLPPSKIISLSTVGMPSYDNVDACERMTSNGLISSGRAYNGLLYSNYMWYWFSGGTYLLDDDYNKYMEIRYPHESEYWEYVYNYLFFNATGGWDEEDFYDGGTFNQWGLMTYLTWLETFYPGYYIAEKLNIKDKTEMTFWESIIYKFDQIVLSVVNFYNYFITGEIFTDLGTSIKNLFVPSDSSYFKNWIDDRREEVMIGLGGFKLPFEVIETLSTTVSNWQQNENYVITVPSVKMTVKGVEYKAWDSFSYNLGNMLQYSGVVWLRGILVTVTTGMVCWLFVSYLIKKLKEMFGGYPE